MFGSIWQIIRGVYTRHRAGIDRANIDHLRADLRFRLAMVEYAYFGRSGRRVAHCLNELKMVLGEKAVHRYLRALDPDLRTQFVERFQGSRRDAAPESRAAPGRGPARPQKDQAKGRAVSGKAASASNVVPIYQAARKAGGAGATDAARGDADPQPGTRSIDSGD